MLVCGSFCGVEEPVTMVTPPWTEDAISADEMESGVQSWESGIEGSIKRCEALLSMLPVALGKSCKGPDALQETSNKVLRKSRVYVNVNKKNLMEWLEPEWNKNMGLLSNISMSRDISSSPTGSWRSYSFYNGMACHENRDNEPEVTRTRTANSQNKSRYSFQPDAWPERGSSGSSECQSSDSTCEDVSNRACSDSGESAESPVTASSLKDVNITKLYGTDAIVPMHEDNLGGDRDCKKRSPPQREIAKRTQKMLGERPLGMASSMTEVDSPIKLCPQSDTAEKHSSCSSEDSEPTVLKKFTLHTNKNAAELKPTGLPTNYRKADALSQKEWNSSLKFVDSKSKRKEKPSRQEKLKVRTMATEARLSTPKTLAARRACQRVCHVKNKAEEKRGERPWKVLSAEDDASVDEDRVMRFPTPKILAAQRVCYFRLRRRSPDSKPTPERSSKPRVGKKTEAGSKCVTSFVERLGDVQERINSSKRAKTIREKEERDLCSFQPNINSTKYFDVEGYQPIEKRLDCIREQKDKMIIKARDQEAKDLGMTFKPELNPHSVRLLKERTKSPLTLEIIDQSGNTSPRNSSNCCTDLSDPRAKASDVSRSTSVCTFVPEINANTHQILAATALGGCDFLTRQQQFLDKMQRLKRLKQQELSSEFTFQPMRGNANLILRYSPLYRIDENISDMCERLSSDKQRRLSIQQQLADKYYSQFVFRPHIDETSRLLGRPPSIETLYTDQSAKQHKDLMRLLAQEEFRRTCTFRPMVKVTTFAPEEAVLEERKRIKLERLKQEDNNRMLKEIKELEECTFRPMITPLPPKDVDPSNLQIKGVQRHLELQRLAKQMRIDQVEWEKKVFFSHQNNKRPKQQYTIPKPFNFHTGSCSTRCSGSPENRRNRMVPSMPIHPHLCT